MDILPTETHRSKDQTPFQQSPQANGPFLWTREMIAKLTSDQPTLLCNCVLMLAKKVYGKTIGKPVKCPTTEDKSLVSIFLNRIYYTICKEMPLSATSIGKYTDSQLDDKITAFINRIETVKGRFTSLEAPILTDLSVFATTYPHHQDYKKKLEQYRDDYTTILEGDHAVILKEEKRLAEELICRIQCHEERKTSAPSFKLITDSHDIASDEYLKLKIKDYKTRTDDFNKNLQKLRSKIKEMKSARSQFTYSFCFLEYVMQNNCLADAYAKTAFDLWWGSKIIKMVNGTSKIQAKPPESMNEPVAPDFSKLSEEQQVYIVDIFNILLMKRKILKGDEVIELPHCVDPFFAPLLKMTHSWTPLGNRIKTIKDQKLKKRLEDLTELITTTAEKFENLHQQYKLQLRCLDPNPSPLVIGISQLNGNLEDPSDPLESPRLLDEDRPPLEPSEEVTRQAIKDLRQKHMEDYAKMSADQLNKISQEKKQLEETVQERIHAVKDDSVHQLSLKIICNATDIGLESLKKNLMTYQDRSKELKQTLVIVQQKLDTMNQWIEKFKHAFDYFSYLYENNLQNTTSNQLWFNGWYALGYYISIQKGQFKAPKNGATTEDLQRQLDQSSKGNGHPSGATGNLQIESSPEGNGATEGEKPSSEGNGDAPGETNEGSGTKKGNKMKQELDPREPNGLS